MRSMGGRVGGWVFGGGQRDVTTCAPTHTYDTRKCSGEHSAGSMNPAQLCAAERLNLHGAWYVSVCVCGISSNSYALMSWGIFGSTDCIDPDLLVGEMCPILLCSVYISSL